MNGPHHTPRSRPGIIGKQAGFSLAELSVALVVFVLIMLGVLSLFDLNSRLARVQTNVSELQQSMRISTFDMVRTVRMAGRGGLPTILRPLPDPGGTIYPGSLHPDGIAVSVRNNVAANTRIGDAASPIIEEGTDVLTVRGVFSSPLYQTNPAGAGFTVNDVDSDGLFDGGSITILANSPTGVPQDLTALADAVTRTNAGDPESLLLISPLEGTVYAVVEMIASPAPPAPPISQLTVNFAANAAGGGSSRTVQYLSLSPDGRYPNAMSTVSFVGILEEYQYYIREDSRTDPVEPSRTMPGTLSTARFYPGTTVAHQNSAANLQIDIAESIIDLQVALGIDSDLDGEIDEGTDAATRATDDWLFNDVGDNANDTGKWNGTSASDSRSLFYVRLSLVGRTNRRDPNYEAPLLGLVEDKDYSASPFNEANSRTDRTFRRRIVQSVVDLRNLS